MSEEKFRKIEKEIDLLILRSAMVELLLEAYFRGIEHKKYDSKENGDWIVNKAKSTAEKLLKNKRIILT